MPVGELYYPGCINKTNRCSLQKDTFQHVKSFFFSFKKIAWRGNNHLKSLILAVASLLFAWNCWSWQIDCKENPSHCVCNSTNSLSPVPLCKRRFEKCLCSCFLTLHHCYLHSCLVKSPQDGQELPSALFTTSSMKRPQRRKLGTLTEIFRTPHDPLQTRTNTL